MGGYIAKQAVKRIIAQGKHIQDAKVLVMGATFKEDVSDIRNSKVIDVVNELVSFSVKVDLVDPHASSEEMVHEYGMGLIEKPTADYDAIVVAVNHKEYKSMKESDFKALLKDGTGVFIDVKGIFKGQISDLEYWSL
jgi:UDP-N-acetyl-D-galactosamine dehydrogenase